MFQYEVVPMMIGDGATGSDAGQGWATLRAGLNERGRLGFRVVAVSDGAHGGAVIMEREVDEDAHPRRVTAGSQSVSQAADEITRDSAEARGPGAQDEAER
jgi:hypothetical protein